MFAYNPLQVSAMTVHKRDVDLPNLTSTLLSYLKEGEEVKEKSHYVILNNGILKSNSSIFPWSKGYITVHSLESIRTNCQ